VSPARPALAFVLQPFVSGPEHRLPWTGSRSRSCRSCTTRWRASASRKIRAIRVTLPTRTYGVHDQGGIRVEGEGVGMSQ